MIQYKHGNLFGDAHEYIAHGCNILGVMGAGFALQIKERFPECFKMYADVCGHPTFPNEKLLGHVNIYKGNKTTIFNCFTQRGYGQGKQVSYDAVDNCMKELEVFLPEGKQLAMPQIGAGLAGGEWIIIESIIAHRLKFRDVLVYIL